MHQWIVWKWRFLSGMPTLSPTKRIFLDSQILSNNIWKKIDNLLTEILAILICINKSKLLVIRFSSHTIRRLDNSTRIIMELEKFKDETNKIHDHVEIISPGVKWMESRFVPVSTLIAFHHTLGLFYQHGLTSVPAWIDNHISSNVWDNFCSYPSPNFEQWSRENGRNVTCIIAHLWPYGFVFCDLKHSITNVIHEIKAVLKKYETK